MFLFFENINLWGDAKCCLNSLSILIILRSEEDRLIKKNSNYIHLGALLFPKQTFESYISVTIRASGKVRMSKWLPFRPSIFLFLFHLSETLRAGFSFFPEPIFRKTKNFDGLGLHVKPNITINTFIEIEFFNYYKIHIYHCFI